MKKLIIIALAIFCSYSLMSQEGHKINADIDYSFGLYYFDNDINNPIAGGLSLGYEYDVNMFLGIEAGFRFGGFKQKTGHYEGPNSPDMADITMNETQYPENIYKGTYWAPYIAPIIYLPVSYNDRKDRARFVFIENRFSYTRTKLNLDKANNMSGNMYKNRITYEIRGGYKFPLSSKWGMSCWIGYSSFDFSKVKPSMIRYKNSTPLQAGIGFNYIIKGY